MAVIVIRGKKIDDDIDAEHDPTTAQTRAEDGALVNLEFGGESQRPVVPEGLKNVPERDFRPAGRA